MEARMMYNRYNEWRVVETDAVSVTLAGCRGSDLLVRPFPRRDQRSSSHDDESINYQHCNVHPSTGQVDATGKQAQTGRPMQLE